MDNANPKILVEYADDVTIAKITSEKVLEETDIQGLEGTLLPLIEQNDRIKLVIDFSEVRFLSSSVLGLLIRISKKVYETRGQLILCGINTKIMEIFRITRLDKIFDIAEDKNEAVKTLGL